MKHKIKIIVAVFVGLIFSLFYSIIDKPTPIYDTECDTSNYGTIELFRGDSVTQRFNCGEDKLDGLTIKVSSIGDQSKVFFDYQIADSATEEVLARGESSLENLQSGKFFRLQFNEINNTRNKQYLLTINVQEKSEDNGIQIFTTSTDNENSFLKVGDETIEATLVLRYLTHKFDFETFFVTVCFIMYIIVFMKWMYKLFK